MRPSRRFSKRTTIAEVDRHLDIEPHVVHATDDLLTVAHRAIERPNTRVLAVIDADERLVACCPSTCGGKWLRARRPETCWQR